MPPRDVDLIDSAEAAETLGISRATLSRRVADGAFDAVYEMGGARLFSRREIEDMARAERGQHPTEDGHTKPSALLAAAAVLAAILVGVALPAGTGLMVLVLAVASGVAVRELLRAHLHGLERLARSRQQEQGVAR